MRQPSAVVARAAEVGSYAMNDEKLRRWETWGSIFSKFAMPMATLVAAGVVGYFGWSIQREIAEQAVAAEYVRLATEVLMKPATKEVTESGMRCWALKLLIVFAPKDAPIPERLRKAMLEGRIVDSWDGSWGDAWQGWGTQADPECDISDVPPVESHKRVSPKGGPSPSPNAN